MSDDSSDYDMRRELPTDIDWNKLYGRTPKKELQRRLARERYLKFRALMKR